MSSIRHRFTLGLIALVCGGLCVDSVGAAERWAIVVGINSYENFVFADGSRPRPLRGAESDAEQMAGLLIGTFGFPEDHVQILRGTQASHADVAAAFAVLHDKAGPDDVVVVHFSGHGTQVADRKPFDEADGLDEALCLADATGAGEQLLLDDQFGLWLDDLPARDVTVILDCCHAGTGTKELDPAIVPRYLPMPGVEQPVTGTAAAVPVWRELQSSTKGSDRRFAAFFACQADQQAYERRFPDLEAPGRAGQFTRAVLVALTDGVADTDGDGLTSNGELTSFVRQQLDEAFNHRRTEPRDRQEPLLAADSDSAMVFGVAPARAADAVQP